LRTILSAEVGLEVVGECSSLEEAVSKARMSPPHVLVMDVMLLQMAGDGLLFAMRQMQRTTAVFFLTHSDEPGLLELAISAGARGYMLKSSAAAQLGAAVHRVAGGGDQDPREISQSVPDLQALAQSNDRYPRVAALTSREQEILKLLAEGRTVRGTAAELSLSVKTVEAHKLNLMRKLDIHNRANLIEYAIEKGVIERHALPRSA
jgi:two-component system, NarL family, response regulator NreC